MRSIESRINAEGFALEVDGERLESSGSCSAGRATIYLRESSIDVDEIPGEIQTLDERDMARHDELQTRLLDACDWPELYNRVVEIRQSGVDQPEFTIVSDSKLPFAVVVRVMDVLRYELEEERYESKTQFWDAQYRIEDGEPVELFPSPLLQISD